MISQCGQRNNSTGMMSSGAAPQKRRRQRELEAAAAAATAAAAAAADSREPDFFWILKVLSFSGRCWVYEGGNVCKLWRSLYSSQHRPRKAKQTALAACLGSLGRFQWMNPDREFPPRLYQDIGRCADGEAVQAAVDRGLLDIESTEILEAAAIVGNLRTVQVASENGKF